MIWTGQWLTILHSIKAWIEFCKKHEIELTTNLKTGVATTSPYKNRVLVLEALQLHEFFAVIVGGEETKHGKPHPEIYLTAAERLGVNPKKCLAFEDTPSGIKSAKGAGMTVVAVLTSHAKEELSEADYFIKDFTEVI